MKEQEFYKGIANVFNDHFTNHIDDDIKGIATDYVNEYYNENGSIDIINIWSDSLEGVMEVELEKTTEKVKGIWNEYIKGRDPKDIPIRLDGDIFIAFHKTGNEIYMINISLDIIYLQSVGDVQITIDGCKDPQRILFKTKYDEPEFYIHMDHCNLDIYAYAEETTEDEENEITWGDDE